MMANRDLVPVVSRDSLVPLRPPGMFKRLTQRIANRGLTGDFFSPELPLAPRYPQSVGRLYDYPSGYNLWIQPRRDTGFLFEDLKNFARWYDLLRLVMQTRMDQVTAQGWEITRVDGTTKSKLTPADKKAIDQITDFWRKPDGRLRWRGWLRAMLNDSFTLDAMVMWPVYNGRRLAALERIDASTIKMVIDNSGRLAPPPFPAYQQILHGQVANEYRANDLLYFMENPGNDRVYGYSRVEQSMMTIQIGMRHQMSQLQFFTEGSIPDALASVPESWTAEQIQNFQSWWDTTLSGDTGMRRKMRFIPDAVKVLQTKPYEAILKPEQSEWVARIICYAFSVSSQPFVKQMNRATAETAQEEAKEEGLAPYLGFLEDSLTEVIQGPMGFKEFRFGFQQQEDVDPETQAKVDDTYVKNGVLSIDEVRERMGKEPLGVKHMIYLATGPIPVENIKDESYTPPGVTSPQDQELHDAKVKGIKSGKLNADGSSPKPPPIADGSTPTDKDKQQDAENAGRAAAKLRKGGGPERSRPFRDAPRRARHRKRGEEFEL